MPSNLPRYTLRIEDTMMKKIKFISDYNGRSANREIEQLIKKHIANFEKEHGEIKINED